MRQTFGQLLQSAKDYTVDDQTTSQSSLTNTELFLKREINNSISEINSLLSNYKNQETERTITTSTDVIYYGYPSGLNQLVSATMEVGSIKYTLEIVHSQQEWNEIQVVEYDSSTVPKYVFPRAKDMGIYPTPRGAYTVRLTGFYQPINMTADDYRTGTVALPANSKVITGTDTTFTSSMIGRWFAVTSGLDGEVKGRWHKIVGFTSATEITLETYNDDITYSGANYVIGESPELPEEMIDFVPLHTASRYMLTRLRDTAKSREFMNMAMTGNPADDRRDSSVKQGIYGIINKYKLGGRGNSQILTLKKHRYTRFDERWTTSLQDS